MKDIETREDIVAVLEAFYEKAYRDELIGHFFTEVVPLDLTTHIPLIADFWESVVLQTQRYRRNVMEIHRHIHQLKAIKKEHLNRWVQLFTTTVDGLFEGEKAILMKQRAASVATLMDLKLNYGDLPGAGN
jgi:hemoglobin